jgi:hypothetical protein
MALFRVKPTSVDEDLANEIASKANPVPEQVAGVLTWGADEHLILGCAAAAWIALTISRSPLRPASSHLLLVTAASAALPHGLKLVFDQVRPDRKTLRVISRASRCPETASTHFRRAMRFIWVSGCILPSCSLAEAEALTEYVLRFMVGGLFVSLFAIIREVVRPKSFAG